MSYITRGYHIIAYITRGYHIIAYITRGYHIIAYITRGCQIISYITHHPGMLKTIKWCAMSIINDVIPMLIKLLIEVHEADTWIWYIKAPRSICIWHEGIFFRGSCCRYMCAHYDWCEHVFYELLQVNIMMREGVTAGIFVNIMMIRVSSCSRSNGIVEGIYVTNIMMVWWPALAKGLCSTSLCKHYNDMWACCHQGKHYKDMWACCHQGKWWEFYATFRLNWEHQESNMNDLWWQATRPRPVANPRPNGLWSSGEPTT